MNLDLKEIEKRLSAKKLGGYLNCNSTYEAKFIKRDTIPNDYKNIPLYELTNIEELGMEISDVLERGDRYCFGTYLNYGRSMKSYRHIVNVYINYRKRKDESYNNYLWMSREQLEDHINYLRNTIGLDFFFRILDAGDWYIVQYDFKELSKLQIKYVLFWTRYTYEFPSSLCMVDAYILKERHPEEDLHNLLRIPQRFTTQSRFPVNSSQSISVYGKFVTLEQLKTRLKRNNLTVCGLFETENQNTLNRYTDFFSNLTKNIKYPVDILDNGRVNFSAWLHDNKRLDKYEEMLEWYKQHQFKIYERKRKKVDE